jgi:hypothetical protein
MIEGLRLDIVAGILDIDIVGVYHGVSWNLTRKPAMPQLI